MGLRAALLMALCFLAPGDAWAMSYRVLEKSGEVRIFAPWSARWRQVAPGQSLRAGSLVVVADGATLVYERLNSGGRADVLSIKTPLAFRVGDDEVRQIRIHPRFLDKLPSSLTENLDAETGLPIPLKEAWDRQLALLKPSEENQKLLAKQQARNLTVDQKVGIDVNSDAVKIVTPKDRTYLVAQGMPHAIELEWKGHGRAKPPYIISIWKDQETPRVLATTEDESYRLELTQFGEYTVSVQGTDEQGRATAAATIQVSVKPPVGQGPAATLKLLDPLPPAGLVLAVETLPYAVEFAWREAKRLGVDEIYELVLTGGSGAPRTEVADVPFFALEIGASGEYTWKVRVLKKGLVPPVVVAESASRTLSVVRAGVATVGIKKRGMVYVER